MKACLACPFPLPVLTPVNNADKVSAVKCRQPKNKTCWSSHKIQENRSTLDSPSTSLGWETKLGVKVGFGCENAVKAAWLILRRTIVTLMIHCVFLLSGPTDPDSLLSGFKEAEDYISFVCLLEGENTRHRDLVLGERQTRASSQATCQTDRKLATLLSL